MAGLDGIAAGGRPGPGSVAWRINGERLAVLGWGRAILLQLAHPLVAAGVADHSSFRGSPLAHLSRFHATLGAMLALTFGSDGEAADAVRRIRVVHDRVHGTLADPAGTWPAGTRYSAHDPRLLAWVNLTLLDSVPLVYDRFVAPLGDEDMGRYAAESRWSAERLGVNPCDVPGSAAEVRRALAAMLEGGDLAVTPRARELARSVVYPPLGWLSGPIARVHALSALAWLPEGLRDEYGFRWTPADTRALDAWAGRLRSWSGRAPALSRRWARARRAERDARARRPVP